MVDQVKVDRMEEVLIDGILVGYVQKKHCTGAWGATQGGGVCWDGFVILPGITAPHPVCANSRTKRRAIEIVKADPAAKQTVKRADGVARELSKGGEATVFLDSKGEK